MLCDSTQAQCKNSFVKLISDTATTLQQQNSTGHTPTTNQTETTGITIHAENTKNSQNPTLKQSYPITRPHIIGRPKVKRYLSMNESIMKASKKHKCSSKNKLFQQDSSSY